MTFTVGRPGLIPSDAYYDKAYGKNRWNTTFTISNAIGQGEVLATPIQLANMAAAIGNRGYFYTPHIIKTLKDRRLLTKLYDSEKYHYRSRHFEPVVQGMFDVYNKGTANILRIPRYRNLWKNRYSRKFYKNKWCKKSADRSFYFCGICSKG